MRRPYVLLTIGVVVILFLAISALLARVFSADSAERTAITALLDAEAKGNANAVAAQINHCSASVRALHTGVTTSCASGATNAVGISRGAGSRTGSSTE